MNSTLELKNVSKTIGSKKIIDDLSFSVQPGEIFGLLGPNGAGKTTTIRMIVGLMKTSSGEISICGHNVKTDFENALRHIGGIVENPELYKYLTGYQNLMQFARMSNGVTKERVDEIVEFVGLTERIHHKVKTYSLGMRQRLGLAQSLLHEPKVMVLDEPTNGLDPAGIREFRDHLKKLTKERGMSVIVSSHLLSEMEMMCDRIAIIQEGKLVNIQSVNGDASEEKGKYFFEIDMSKEKSLQDLQELNIIFQKVKDGIEIEMKKEDVPNLIQKMAEKGIQIYAVKPVSRSLEDRFLEITNKKEGNVIV